MTDLVRLVSKVKLTLRTDGNEFEIDPFYKGGFISRGLVLIDAKKRRGLLVSYLSIYRKIVVLDNQVKELRFYFLNFDSTTSTKG